MVFVVEAHPLVGLEIGIMLDQSAPQQFVLLPSHGLRASRPEERRFLSYLYEQEVQGNRSFTYSSSGSSPMNMRVLDHIYEDGAKLVEMSLQSAELLRTYQQGIRIEPLVSCLPAYYSLPTPRSGPTPATSMTNLKTTIKVISRNGSPVEGANVIWFRDFAERDGKQGVTNSQGEVSFLGTSTIHAEELYIEPLHSFWSLRRQNIVLNTGSQFELTPIDLTYHDGVRYFYDTIPDDAGQGVKVGVIDTGIANHPDLRISGGENTAGEGTDDYGDNGDGTGHGTHVAGIIAARGMSPHGIRGMAPAAELFSYRAYRQGKHDATSFAVAKAIERAVDSGCHLINMSLTYKYPDLATQTAIDYAYSKGTLIIAAAGNNERQSVSFPASSLRCIAVSAMGCIGTFPADTVQQGCIAPPFGNDTRHFIASFSNCGPKIALTAPGVGIISTFPGRSYAVLDGTSMATPAVTGAAARILAQAENILTMNADEARVDAMVRVIFQNAQQFGFGATFEGSGLLVT